MRRRDAFDYSYEELYTTALKFCDNVLMSEFEENDDGIDFTAPLDLRFVVLGVVMMILSLLALAFSDDVWIKGFCFFSFLASFFIMTKRKGKSLS